MLNVVQREFGSPIFHVRHAHTIRRLGELRDAQLSQTPIHQIHVYAGFENWLRWRANSFVFRPYSIASNIRITPVVLIISGILPAR